MKAFQSLFTLFFVCVLMSDTNIDAVFWSPAAFDFGTPSGQSSSPQCRTPVLFPQTCIRDDQSKFTDNINQRAKQLVKGNNPAQCSVSVGRAYNRCRVNEIKPKAVQDIQSSTGHSIVCAVQSVNLWGEGSLKKWSGLCNDIKDLRDGIKQQFSVDKDFDLQYLDRDVSEYIDLEDYVFEDFRSQQYKLVRLIFPAKSNKQQPEHSVSNVLPANLNTRLSIISATLTRGNDNKLMPLNKTQAQKTIVIPEKKERCPRKSPRSCRKKPISYAELSSSSPIPVAESVPSERTFSNISKTALKIKNLAGEECDPAETLAIRLQDTHLVSAPSSRSGEAFHDDSDDLLKFDSLGFRDAESCKSGVDENEDDESPLYYLSKSGPPSSTDANSLGASPTIPDGLKPLPPRCRTPDPRKVIAHLSQSRKGDSVVLASGETLAEPATPRNAVKQLRFQLPDGRIGDDDLRGEANTAVPPITPAGFTAVTPTPDRLRGVVCSQDDETGLFHTARRFDTASYTATASPATPHSRGRSPSPSARRTLFPESPGAETRNAEPTGVKLQLSGKAFRLRREDLARELLRDLNSEVFGGQLPADLEIRWSGAYTRTAGMTSFKLRYNPDETAEGGMRVEHTAAVELSSKVLQPSKTLATPI
jgi:hypothetical protein